MLIENRGHTSPPSQIFTWLGSGLMALNTSFDGRMEKRLPIAIIVQLSQRQAQSPNGVEMTYTDNVSAHGARVISNRLWQPGEDALVTSIHDEITLQGKVVYCRKLPDARYSVGLNFNSGGVTWSAYKSYSRA